MSEPVQAHLIPSLTANAIKVLQQRYLTKDAEGNPIETPEDMFRRVANTIAAAEHRFAQTTQNADALAAEFYSMMAELLFLPNSPTLMNAGRDLGQLSACFVLPIDDSMEGIFDAIKHTALIHKSGGGTGFSFSRLRPARDRVASTSGVSSGPISFMKVFNLATETIKQGGTRRGANMGMLRIDHPDILEFIAAKKDGDALTNFNISVAITDVFMQALRDNRDYALINPRSGEEVRRLPARDVFDRIVRGAWQNGEPGIVFIDRVNQTQPTPAVGAIEATNPCGEQPLLPFESCNLGSINLGRFVTGKKRTPRVDFTALQRVVHLAVRFLDNVIEVNRYPLPQIEQMTRANRKIGLGVMGFADLLIRLGIPYASNDALETAEEVMGFIEREARAASAALARERGPFPNFAGSRHDRPGEPPLRNATVTTIAPTGTISLIANASSGIEPLFAVAYVKNVMDGERLVEVNPLFIEVAKAEGFHSPELMDKIAETGSLVEVPGIPESIRQIYTTAHEIEPLWHIRMQAAFQKHCDNAVSKTVNLPHDATPVDVATVYHESWKLGCKGVTVYRDGSREEQVITFGKGGAPGSHPETAAQNWPKDIVPRPRPERTTGVTEKVRIGCGNLYITVNSDEHGICEVFTSLGRAGGCPSQSEATSRLASLALRAGVKVEEIIGQLKGIRCLSTMRQSAGNTGVKVLSCPDAIGKALRAYHETHGRPSDGSAQTPPLPGFDWVPDTGRDPGRLCPECHETIEHEGGCMICRACGYSRCG